MKDSVTCMILTDDFDSKCFMMISQLNGNAYTNQLVHIYKSTKCYEMNDDITWLAMCVPCSVKMNIYIYSLRTVVVKIKLSTFHAWNESLRTVFKVITQNWFSRRREWYFLLFTKWPLLSVEISLFKNEKFQMN